MRTAVRLSLPLVALMFAWAAVAQTQNGGIVNGQHTEPRPSQVLPAERATGVAPSTGQADRNAGTVDQLDKELLGKEQRSPPSRSSVPPIQSGKAQ